MKGQTFFYAILESPESPYCVFIFFREFRVFREKQKLVTDNINY
jgi:hypothetical protein